MDESATPSRIDLSISTPSPTATRPTGHLDKGYVPEQFINRELSQLEFNRRVLAQAEDPDTPPLERLRFLCIFSSNLDEFYEIRIAGLKEQIKQTVYRAGHDSALLQALISAVLARCGPASRSYRKTSGYGR